MVVKTALEAMNEALGVPEAEVETPETPEEEEIETPEGEESTESDDSDAGETEETEETEESTDEGDETEESDDSDEETDESETETPEAKVAREKQEAADAKTPPDHVNDPIPEGLNKRTSERIRTLAETVKELTPRAEQGDELLSYVKASGMDANQFSMALTFGRLRNSSDIGDQRKAYAILMQGLKELAPRIGETLPGVDLLEGHADLKLRVEAKTLDPKDAAEIAAGRNRTRAETAAVARAETDRATARTQSEATAAVEEQARVDMNELGNQLKQIDARYDAKLRALQANGTFKKIANMPPQLRTSSFLRAFRSVTLPAVVAKKKVGQQPLRANKTPASGSGVKRAPRTAVEAMNFALDGRRE